VKTNLRFNPRSEQLMNNTFETEKYQLRKNSRGKKNFLKFLMISFGKIFALE
jgi:hypothetical protein